MPADVHPRLQIMLWVLEVTLPDAERRWLESVDLHATSRGETGRSIELAAVDGMLHELAPLELEAMGRGDEALALRALPPIRDRDSVETARAAVAAMSDAEQEREQASDDEAFEISQGLYLGVLALEDLASEWDRMNELYLPPDGEETCVENGEVESREANLARAALERGAPAEAVARAAIAVLERMIEATRAPSDAQDAPSAPLEAR